MSTTTVRIPHETREVLRDLEHQTGQGPQELVARAVDHFRRSLILAESNIAFARQDGLDELAEIEGTLGDGLADGED